MSDKASEPGLSGEPAAAFPVAEARAETAPGLTYRDLQRGIFLVFGLILVYQMAGPLTTLLLFFLLVFILSAVVNPLAVRLLRFRVPRVITAGGVATLLIGGIVLIIWLSAAPVVAEARDFLENLDGRRDGILRGYAEWKESHPDLAAMLPPPEQVAESIKFDWGKLLGQVGRYTANAAVGILSLFLLVVLMVYTVSHPGPLVAGLLSMSPERYRPRVDRALRRILEQLKNWALGSLVLGLIIGVTTGVALKLLGVRNPLLFGIIAGIGEMVPNIGPVLSAVPPVLMALAEDPVKAFWVLALFVVIQQLENNLIVPLVMGQSLQLHPLSVTFTVLVMGVLFGLLGAILAVPVCAIVKVCWEEFYLYPRGVDADEMRVAAEDIVGAEEPALKAPRLRFRRGA